MGAGQATTSLGLIDRATVGTVAAVGRVDAALAGLGPTAARSATRATGSMGFIERTFQGHSKAMMATANKASTGVLAIGAAAVYSAVEWQKKMTVLQTATGESASNIKIVSAGLLDLATTTGAAPMKLADAMFYAEKAGYRGAAGLKVVQAAAQGAAGEGADLGIVMKALTSVMASYGGKADPATFMSKLERGAGLAKTSVQSFSNSLSTVLPIAANAHVSVEEVFGAIGTLTSHGTSAQKATFDLANVFRNLQVPLGPAQKMMQQFGIDSVDLSKNLGKRGLAGTMDIVTQAIGRHSSGGMVLLDSFKRSKMAGQDLQVMFGHMPAPVKALSSHLLDGSITMRKYMTASNKLPPKQAVMARQFRTLFTQSNGFNDSLKAGGPAALTMAAALKTMFGGQVGLNTVLQLTGTSAASFADRTVDISKQVMDANGNVATWHETMDTAATKLGQLRGELFKTGVAIGTDLLPALLSVAHFFQRSVAWVGRNKDLALSIIEVAAGFKILRLAMMLMTKGNPLLLLISAVAVGLVYLYNHSQKFRDIVQGVFKAVGVAAKWTWDTILHPVFNFITGMFTGIGKAASWVWDNVLHPVFKMIGEAWPVMAGGIRMAWEGTIKPALDELGKFFSWIYRQYIQPFFGVVQKVWGAISGVFSKISSTISGTATIVKVTLKAVWDSIVDFFNKKLPGAVADKVALHDPGYLIQMAASRGPATTGAHYWEQFDGSKYRNSADAANHMAGGGRIVGPGGPRDDKVPLWGSNGEYMVNAASTAKYGPLLDHINADKYAKGGLIGAADQVAGKTTGMIYGKVADVLAQNKWVKMSALFGSGGSQFTAALRVAGAAMAATGAAAAMPGAPKGVVAPIPSASGGAVGSVLTPMQMAQFLRGAGFPISDIPLGVAVGLAESSGRTKVTHLNSNGSTDFGVWQINNHAHPEFAAQWANGSWANPATNAAMARSVWAAAGNSWRPWTTFTGAGIPGGDPAYPRFMAQGQAALKQMGYDQGGWLPAGGHGRNNLTKPEAVLTPEESRGLKAGGSIGRGGMTIENQSNHIEINISGDGDPDAISEAVERRFRALMENMINTENDRSYSS